MLDIGVELSKQHKTLHKKQDIENRKQTSDMLQEISSNNYNIN